jgi:peptidoglycan DL-endopeptidase CwlO
LKPFRSRIGAVVIASALILAALPGAAWADRISDKQLEATRVQGQIRALDTKVEIAAERYNQASERYATLTTKVQRTSVKLAGLRKHIGSLQSGLGNRAERMYRSGPLGFLEVLLEAKSFEDFTTSWDVLTDISAQDADNVSSLKTAKKQSEATYNELKNAQSEAKAQKKARAAYKASVKTQLAQRKTMLNNIKADIRSLIAQREAAEEAAARARVYSSGFVMDEGGDPPSSSKGAAAVWWAEKALGAPYVWAASGPNAFDCSGLCMWAYGKVGVSLPHYSGAQYNAGPHVSRANLEPGDLVFFGSPIHPVGMYVGNGNFIEAPYTGSHVRIRPLTRGDYVGACRPG